MTGQFWRNNSVGLFVICYFADSKIVSINKIRQYKTIIE